MKKTLLFCGLFAIAALNFLSCDDEDENNNGNTTNNGGGTTTSNLSAEFISASDCQGSPYGDGTRADGAEEQIRIPFIAYKYDSSKGEVELNLENAVIYDLSGRRVENPGRGIYIVNGHKVLIK
jgi:hypothetical protein